MIGRAERSIVIESPYLLGDHIERALLAATRRGVRVTIILPHASNKLMYRLWSRKLRRRLAHHNAALYGYQGNGGMTHAKLLMVDDRWATFGSFNMIELEGITQKELNVFTGDVDLIEQLQQFVARDLAQSTPLAPARITGGRFTYYLLHRIFRTDQTPFRRLTEGIYCQLSHTARRIGIRRHHAGGAGRARLADHERRARGHRRPGDVHHGAGVQMGHAGHVLDRPVLQYDPGDRRAL